MKITRIMQVAALALLMPAIISCDSRKFHITGAITEAKDSTLYLENMSLDGANAVDSVKLDADGDFRFSLKANDAPEFYRLRIDGQIINLSVDSTETVTVKASYPTMAYKYEVSGSDNCSKIRELALHQMTLQSQINSIISNPTLKVTAVQDSLAKVVDKYKQFVKSEYIFKEPNKSYAYFALFQTFVAGNSYNLIFNPRNNADDVKVFAAVATSWDTFHPGAIRGTNLHNIAIEGMKNVRIIAARDNATIEAEKVDMSGIVDLALTDNQGVTRRLSDLKGKVVMLDFCSFAQQGVTERIMLMRDLYNKFHAQGFEIYQVSLDTEEHFWQTQTRALPWVSVRDANGAALVRYNVSELPTFFLISRDGTPQLRDLQVKDIEAEIRKLL